MYPILMGLLRRVGRSHPVETLHSFKVLGGRPRFLHAY